MNNWNGRGIVYVTKNLVNGKLYVGIHTKNMKGYLGSGTLLLRAIKKYGKENFLRKTIDEFETIEEGCAKEKYWIKELGTKNPIGYNLCDGGIGLFNPTEEVRRKMSIARLGTHPKRETIEKMRASRKGVPSWNKGKKLTIEQREKLSKAHLGYKDSPEERKNKSISATRAWAIRKGGPGGVPLSTLQN